MKRYVLEIIEPNYEVKLVATPRPDVVFSISIVRSDQSSIRSCGSPEALAKLVDEIRKEVKEKSDRIQTNTVAMESSLLTLGFIEHES